MDSIESSSTCNSSSAISSAWDIQPALDSISSNIPQLESSLHNAQSYVIVAILGLLILILACSIYFTLRKSDHKSPIPSSNIAIVEASLIPESNENPSLLNEVKEESLDENKFQSSSAVQSSEFTPLKQTIAEQTVSNNTNQIPETPYSTLSTLTPDSAFKHGLKEPDTRSRASSRASSNAGSESVFSDDEIDNNADIAIRQSVVDPKVLVGWRVLVEGYGSGTILSIKRKKFQTTCYVIQFDNGKCLTLALKRSKKKGIIPFSLLRKIV